MNTTPSTHPVRYAGLKKPWFPSLAILALAVLGSQPAIAVDRLYDPTLSGCSGNFIDLNCWVGGVVPGAVDNAVYDTGAISAYTINFTAPITNTSATINTDNLIWDLGTNTYSLTADLTVGHLSGDVANLQIQNGTVSNVSSFIGQDAGATGTVTVSGTGSTWTSSDLVVGFGGTGILNIDSGGQVYSRYDIVGSDGAAGNGTVTVSGAGSLWDNSIALFVGYYGIGDLSIDSGGQVTTTNAGSLGTDNGGNGTATVSGVGSAWTMGQQLYVGGQVGTGTGTLNIDTSGLVSNSVGYLGNSAGSTGTATVSSGGAWNNNDSLYVGGSSTVAGGTGVLNANMGSNVNVTNLLKLWGGGTVNLAGGAITAGSFDSSLGTFNFTDGALTVNGSTGIYTDGNVDLVVDSTGVGDNPTLVLSNGASADYAGGNATIGLSGAGSLTINSGGLVTNNVGTLGRWVGSSSTAMVSGTGSLWENEIVLNVGYEGTGILNIDSGGQVTTDVVQLGRESTGNGTAMVTGAGSTWSVDQQLYVGLLGIGDLSIDGGGSVSNMSGYLGGGGGGIGTATVTGAGSTWANSSDFTVGLFGTGTLDIDNGGSVTTIDGFLGSGSASSNGTATVGSGGVWANSGSLYVGGDVSVAGGTGVVNVNTGGTVNVTNLLKVWSSGTVNLNGGTINTGMLDPLDGTFNFTAGTLNLTSSDLLVETGGILGSAISLSSFKSLGVSGTTTLNGASTLSLDGGTFSTGSLVNNGGFTFNKGTFNLSGDNLVVGLSGLFGALSQFDFGQTVNVTNTMTVDSGAILYMNGGTLNSGTIINNGLIAMNGSFSTLGGGALTNFGEIEGDGRVNNTLANQNGSEVRVGTGESMRFTAAGNTNAGRIEVIGGEVEFDQGLINQVSTGSIVARDVTLRFGTGLANQGSVGFSFGTSDVFGDVDNTGTVIQSGSGNLTFYDDFINNGTVQTSIGSNVVFFGSVSGAGSYVGSGAIFFEGDLSPGNSPALVNMGGDMTLGTNAHTTMELGGLLRGDEYDAFDIGGILTLDGELGIELYDLNSGLFAPGLGDSFDLFMADIILGDFDLLTLAALDIDLGWQLDFLTDEIGSTDVVRLSVVASAVPVPPAVWLFGSGLLGLIGVARRRQHH
jgi:fibronectin-binding autotransporter adhesin